MRRTLPLLPLLAAARGRPVQRSGRTCAYGYRTEVLRIVREHGTAATIGSHGRADARHLVDRIAVMNAERTERIGPAYRAQEEWASHSFTS